MGMIARHTSPVIRGQELGLVAGEGAAIVMVGPSSQLGAPAAKLPRGAPRPACYVWRSMRLDRVISTLGTAALAASLLACSKPEPPTLTPEGAKVKSIGPKGLELELTIEVDNPNAVPLRARSVTADVTVGGSVKLGEVTVETPVKVPAKGTGTVTAPISLGWQNAASVAVLAATRETIPFTVAGTANVGIEDVRFDVPFEAGGTLTRAQLMSIGAGAVPIPIPTALPKLF